LRVFDATFINTNTKGSLMTKKWLVALLSAVAMTFSAGAMAQGTMSGAYVGLDVGRSEFVDEDDTGFRLFGGFQFHRNIAAEVAYGLLFDKGGVEITALELAAIGMFPVANQFSVIGKLGFARLEADGGGDDSDFVFGIGAQYDVTRNLGVRLQWTRYNTDPELDFLSLGVLWKF
jgi:OOP family OmpA-OmpF porin